jgi:hypothetical protein
MGLPYITPSHVARHVGISDDRAREYLRDVDPREAPRLRQRFESSRLPELATICEAKRKRRYRNPNNSSMIGQGVSA